MAKHRADFDFRAFTNTLKMEVFYLRNRWHCFVKPSLKRMLAGKRDAWRMYYRSDKA